MIFASPPTIVLAVQRFANEHPHLYRLAMTRPTKPESAFEITAEAVAILRAAGLSERDAVHAYNTSRIFGTLS